MQFYVNVLQIKLLHMKSNYFTEARDLVLKTNMAEFTFKNLHLRGRTGHLIISVYKQIRKLRFWHDITVDNINVSCCSSPVLRKLSRRVGQSQTREDQDSSKSNGVTVQPPYDTIAIDPT
jgi:hypothetical protein